MKKRFLAKLLTLVMVVGLMPATAWAEGTGSENEGINTGAAAETKVTEVSTAAELLAFANAVNGGETFEGETVKLVADIDLAGTPWLGIGVYNESADGTAFQGTFDGNGKTISNVTFKDNGSEDTNKYRGFFNQLYRATVKNVTIECDGFASGISGKYGGAVIAGHAISSTIQNCVSEGTLTGTHNVAGIVVRMEGSTIRDCTNKASLTNSYSKLGGIVNLSQHSGIDTENKASLIEGCVNTGAITSTAHGEDGVGGIIGWVGYSGNSNYNGSDYALTIKDCENKGIIEGTATAKVGQLIGFSNSHLTVLGGNKGLETMFIEGNSANNVPHFATVANGVATYYTGTLTAGEYLVVVANPREITKLNLENGQSISFDTTLSGKGPAVNVTGMELIDKTEGKIITYTVASAKVGETKYATVADAITAAGESGTVTLLYDITTPVTIDGSIKLDLNGKTVDAVTVAAGASLELSGTGTVTALTVADGASVTKAADMNITAPAGYGWKDNALTREYKVTFVEDGKDDVVKTVFAGEKVTNIPSITTVKEGYNTPKWIYDGAEFTSETVINADITVTAQWTANTYTVTFNANSNDATGTMAPQTIAYGSDDTLTSNAFKHPTMKFAGWAETENGVVAYADAANATTMTTANNGSVELYAVWTAKDVLNPVLDKQTTTYNGQNQAFVLDGFTAAEITYKQGDEVVAPKNAGTYDVVINKAETDTTAAYSTTIPGGLVIEKAKLTATYISETIRVGKKPALEVEVTGFVNGETEATADGYTAPTVTTDATAKGVYTLTPEDGEAANYEFKYVEGTLTIKKKSSSSDDGGSSSGSSTTTDKEDVKEEVKEEKPEEKPVETPEEKPAETPAEEGVAQENIVLTIGNVVAMVDGMPVVNDVAPIIKEDRTMLPIRFVAEALGAEVGWSEAESKVTIAKGDVTIEIFIGQPFALVNGQPVQLDAPAFIENGRTYLPLRFVAEALGAAVAWDANTNAVTIVPNK